MSRSTSRSGAAAGTSTTSNVTIENASELSFPAEFDTDIQILSNAQVAVILQMSAQNALTYDMELNEIYKKTQKYVERYNTMKNPEKNHQELVDELDNLQKLSN
jgi:DNA-directed RNA polymerase II subunit RPB4